MTSEGVGAAVSQASLGHAGDRGETVWGLYDEEIF